MKPHPRSMPMLGVAEAGRKAVMASAKLAYMARVRNHSWRAGKKEARELQALETRLRQWDPIQTEELFTEAQLENFHRKVMSAVTKSVLKSKDEIQSDLNAENETPAPSWRSTKESSMKIVTTLPFVSVLGFIIFNLPQSVKTHFQKISSAVSSQYRH